MIINVEIIIIIIIIIISKNNINYFIKHYIENI